MNGWRRHRPPKARRLERYLYDTDGERLLLVCGLHRSDRNDIDSSVCQTAGLVTAHLFQIFQRTDGYDTEAKIS